jgi:hypothetical protein
MKTTLRSALLAAAAVAATLPAALAQPSPPPAGATPPAAQQGRGPGGALFDDMDGNKDGRVAWDEAWTFVQRRFAAADADRDGGLTRQEADALRPARNGGRRAEGGGTAAPATPPSPEQQARRARFGDIMFRSLDANRDGRVTLDEVRPVIEARFRGLDANADNAVSRDELPQRRQGGGPRSNNGSGGGQGGQGGQAPAPAR